MYKTKFTCWGFEKNNTEKIMSKILHVKFKRDAVGKRTQFVRNDKPIDIPKYLKRKGKSEYDLVNFQSADELPQHVRCRTPSPAPGTPRHIQASGSCRTQEVFIHNLRQTFRYWMPCERKGHASVSWATFVGIPPSFEPLFQNAIYALDVGNVDLGIAYLKRAYGGLDSILEQAGPEGILELLFNTRFGSRPELSLGILKYISAYSSFESRKHHPAYQTLAFLYDTAQKDGVVELDELLRLCCQQALNELERLYGSDHPYVYVLWRLLYKKGLGGDKQKFLDALLNRLRKLHESAAVSLGPTSPSCIRIQRFRITLLQACGMISSEETLTILESLEKMIDPNTPSPVATFPYYALYYLYLFHNEKAKVEPASYNPRHELGTHYLAKYIRLRFPPGYFDSVELARCLEILENLYRESGYESCADKVLERRKLCEDLFMKE
jgi:hypothetical protein